MENHKVRILRVLEYEGTREQIDQAIERRGVKGGMYPKGGIIIREAIISETPSESINRDLFPVLELCYTAFLKMPSWPGLAPKEERRLFSALQDAICRMTGLTSDEARARYKENQDG